MGIISRFMDIMSANINSLLDKAEDPQKMIEQYLRDLEKDLGNVKAETATVMAEEARAKREYDEAKAEVDKLQNYAERAVAAGNDADARAFLMSKKNAQIKADGLKTAYEAAANNATKMRQMHDKLVNDIANLTARKEAIKAKAAVAKAQEKVNEVGSSYNGVAEKLAAFDKMEEKANQLLDKEEALAELNMAASPSSIEELTAKYDAVTITTSDIDMELAALKNKMNQ